MGIFKPTAMKERLTAISPRLLENLEARAILLDVDNTIASYTSHEPIEGAVDWVREMVTSGFRVIIVSNNYKRRVMPFAARFGLDCISFALKPFPFGYLRARKRLKTPLKNCVIVGDQIFTDVVGANLCGMKSILLSPIEPEEGVTFQIRRRFERGFRKKFAFCEDILS